MDRAIDETGKIYGPWVVVGRYWPNYKPERASMANWMCKCKHCGAMKVYVGNKLRSDRYAHTCKECGGN
jgi:hypothetical protein|nr:MAG TPA: InsA N-terminal domain [Caudoviricetes sp.]